MAAEHGDPHLDLRKPRMPHQRAVAEDPEILAGRRREVLSGLSIRIELPGQDTTLLSPAMNSCEKVNALEPRQSSCRGTFGDTFAHPALGYGGKLRGSAGYLPERETNEHGGKRCPGLNLSVRDLGNIASAVYAGRRSGEGEVLG
jgi:hypothetical protein